MEVINFKTKFDIGQTVYFLDGRGDVESGEVRSVIFSDSPIQYEISHYSGEVFRRTEDELFDDVNLAIGYGMEQYRARQNNMWNKDKGNGGH